MRQLIIVAMLLASFCNAQDVNLFSISLGQGNRIFMEAELQKSCDQCYVLHADVPISINDFDLSIPGVDLASNRSRYSVSVVVGKMFLPDSVLPAFAFSFKGKDTIAIYYTVKPAPRFPWDQQGDLVAPTATIDLSNLYHHVDSSRFESDHQRWLYWAGKWWQGDLPENADPKAMLYETYVDDKICVIFENINLPEERIRAVKIIFNSGKLFEITAKGNILRRDQVDLTIPDVEAIKNRLLDALKRSL